MKIPLLIFVCSALVICLSVLKPALGQDDAPPRPVSAPRRTVTAQGEGYSYTWCEYTPMMTCYDTTVSTAERQMGGSRRMAVAVPESVSYFPLVAVILFTVLSGVSASLQNNDGASSSGADSSSGGSAIGIATTPSPG